ncbi:DNA mismatch repair protein MutS [SCandidatus Aminicenantes bacterium Aminicenantia_JdfR_composite]|jgi:DNA mismatch repair protein MutS|nr:DNA mismatch repair protein MutS [SCandidatus Aminicenantes bacterium Aminicenantia_JdfR_composite]MCP2606434.1 DNA mismatch repair protein MutS [Candidatus Aminicenantes bacterium AC-708-I09]
MKERNSITPMMKQYKSIKQNYPDAILFFRLGDFYEMFYEDAEIASKILEIALTSRQNAPMCGIPYHAADSYIAKLLKRGYKVAICEQVEDPKLAKGVVKREVIKVLTPGTAVEVEIDEAKESNYIICVYPEKNRWGLALIDLSSGEIRATQYTEEEEKDFIDEIFRLSPRELIFPLDKESFIKNFFNNENFTDVLKNPVDSWVFDFTQAEKILLKHFKVNTLDGFGFKEKELAICAAGGLLYYLQQIRKDSLSFINRISYFYSREYMLLDSSTIRNLELCINLRDGSRKGSLLEIIDFTLTPMGGRLLKQWLLHPLLNIDEINKRLNGVEEFFNNNIERKEIRKLLKNIYDLERITSKINLSVAHPKDLIALKNSILILPKIKSLLEKFSSPILRECYFKWDDLSDVFDLINRAIVEEPPHLLTEGGIIKDGYNKELDELRKISKSGKSFIVSLEKKERERTGIQSLKIGYNKIFGYYIEVTKPNLHLIPEDYIRKQTLVNSERFITPELKEYEEKVLYAEQKMAELEYQIFMKIREEIASQTLRLQKMSQLVALIDVLSSLAELAVYRDYKRPVVHSSDYIKIVDGRHPVIEIYNEEPFIPNDTYLDNHKNQILIVTGPNMGGKSTYLRQVALICLLAQMGSFVPAKEAEIGVIDRIFTRIGAMDFLASGQSTFMVEMIETANILHNATPRSLILLDEIGRGTSTFDGLSIAWAVVEYIHENPKLNAKTLFATHYHELTELALTLERVKNLHVSVKEWKDEIIFLRKILEGPSDKSYGIQVAKLAGVPREVIERAKEILLNLERKEFDDIGRPRLAYRTKKKRDKRQLLLFKEDREEELLREIKEEILKFDLSNLTPLEALNLLNSLQKKLKEV